MRLIHCHIENFGRLQNLDLDFSQGLNQLCRENGWGKSTLAAFLQCMFYGMKGDRKRSLEENERRRYAPWQGGSFGGSLTFEAEGKTYRVTRIFGERESRDVFELVDVLTNLPSRHYSANLGQELFGIDREAFLRTVYIRQNQCVTQATGDIHARISHMAEEVQDMRGYEEAVNRLNREIAALNPHRSTGRLSRRQEEMLRLQRSIDEGAGISDRLAAMQNRLELEEEELRELAESRAKAQDLQTRVAGLQGNLACQEERESRKLSLLRQRKELERCQQAFPGGIPSLDEVEGLLALCGPMERALERSRNYELSEEERLEWRKGQERFQEGLLSQENLEKRTGIIFRVAGIGLLLAAMGLLLFHHVGMGLAGLLAGGLLLCPPFSQKVLQTVLNSLRRDASQYLRLQSREETSRKAREEYENYRSRLREALSSYGIPLQEPVQPLLLKLRDQVDDYLDTLHLLQDYQESLRAFEEEKKDILAWNPVPGEKLPPLAEVNENLREMEEEMDQCRDHIRVYRQAMEGLQQEYDDREENRELLLQKKADQEKEMKRYQLLVKARDGLMAAREEMTARYADPVGRSFRRYYSMVNGSGEDAYQLDANLRIRRQEGGLWRDIESLSAGYQDLVGLCLRIALVDAMYEKEKPMLILDDPFVNLDDGKLLGAGKMLEEWEKDYQILYFTCSNSRKL